MKRSIIFVLGLAPAALAAQQATGTSAGRGEAKSEAVTASRLEFSAEARAKLEATLLAAHEKGLPAEVIEQRIAEGRAKGATEASIVAAAARTEARLEAVHDAMVRAGRTDPAEEEVARGEQAMARGATTAQIEALAEHAPSDRSLVVAFDVLSQLEARGVPVDQALAVIQAKLDARASDEAIAGLAVTAGVNGDVIGGANGQSPAAAAGAAISGTATGAARGSAATGAAVTGTVTGVTRKP